jgi:hypothetical protein
MAPKPVREICVFLFWCGEVVLRESLDDGVGLSSAFTGRVAEPALANAVLKIENHVVIVIRAARL